MLSKPHGSSWVDLGRVSFEVGLGRVRRRSRSGWVGSGGVRGRVGSGRVGSGLVRRFSKTMDRAGSP